MPRLVQRRLIFDRAMMDEARFSGIARLYGAAAAETFANAHVMVIGVGGVGSWTVEALARSGVGHISMVDLDEICLSNVNRQLHAMDGHIGKLKTSAMRERCLAISPTMRVDEWQTFFGASNAAELLDKYPHVVVDAIDAVPQKCLLLAACRQRGIPVITCGAAGGRMDPTLITVSDLARSSNDALLLQTRKKLRTEHGFPKSDGDKKPAKKFGITAIYSTETPHDPRCSGSSTANEEQSLRLNCATGYGTSSMVTGAFGLIAAAQALAALLAIDKSDDSATT
jgi:tRNA threonylcarbamoyladenosine dehydratase